MKKPSQQNLAKKQEVVGLLHRVKPTYSSVVELFG